MNWLTQVFSKGRKPDSSVLPFVLMLAVVTLFAAVSNLLIPVDSFFMLAPTPSPCWASTLATPCWRWRSM